MNITAAALFYALILMQIGPARVECVYESSPESPSGVIESCPAREPRWIDVDFTALGHAPSSKYVQPDAGLRVKIGNDEAEIPIADLREALEVWITEAAWHYGDGQVEGPSPPLPGEADE